MKIECNDSTFMEFFVRLEQASYDKGHAKGFELGKLQTPAVQQVQFPHTDPHLLRLFFDGINTKRKLLAIKAVREMTGMGLAEAKNWIEGLVPDTYWINNPPPSNWIE